jgi:hypothetical protein
MTYTKPEITRLGDAAQLICAAESMLKITGPADAQSPNHQSVPAYSVDE